MERCREILGRSKEQIVNDLKSADWKVETPAYMKKKLLCRNGWLAERLKMGGESSVARYVSEFLRGKRTSVQPYFDKLTTKVLD